MTKICTKCGKEKSLEDFHWRNKAQGTHRSECKECHNNHMKKAITLIFVFITGISISYPTFFLKQ